MADALCVLISLAGLVQGQLPAGATTAERRRSDYALYTPRMGQQRVLATALGGGGVGQTEPSGLRAHAVSSHAHTIL